MDLSKVMNGFRQLLHLFLKIDIWIYLSGYMDLSKLLNWFVNGGQLNFIQANIYTSFDGDEEEDW